MPAVSARIYKVLLSARERRGRRRSDRSETTGRWKILINSSWQAFCAELFAPICLFARARSDALQIYTAPNPLQQWL